MIGAAFADRFLIFPARLLKGVRDEGFADVDGRVVMFPSIVRLVSDPSSKSKSMSMSMSMSMSKKREG